MPSAFVSSSIIFAADRIGLCCDLWAPTTNDLWLIFNRNYRGADGTMPSIDHRPLINALTYNHPFKKDVNGDS